MTWEIKSNKNCLWDLASLGEVMLRFDPGDERIQNTRNFRVWEGGGEYNVARGLSKVFKKKTTLITALVKNPLGDLAEDLIMQGGVDVSNIKWQADSPSVRNGLYFIERGFGLMPPKSCFDRDFTAISQAQAEMISIGGKSSRNKAFAGCTRAEFSRVCPKQRRKSLNRQ